MLYSFFFTVPSHELNGVPNLDNWTVCLKIVQFNIKKSNLRIIDLLWVKPPFIGLRDN